MSTATRTRWASIFRLPADMGLRLRIRSCVLTILLVLTLQPAAPASAGCNFTDIVSAMKTAGETAQACEPVCKDKYRCYATAGLAIILTEVSRRKGQDKVDSFCHAAYGTLEEITQNLQLLGDLTDDQISQLSEAMTDFQTAMAIVKCACKTEELQLKNETSFGACANEFLTAVGCGEIDFSTATIGGCDPVGGVIGGLVNEGLDALVDLGCGILWDCADGSAGPVTSQCIAGTQADQQGKCHYCSELGPHVITQADGLCGCEPPYSSLRVGKRLIADLNGEYCPCKPPSMMVDGYCLCRSGSQLKDGACRPCSASERYVPFHHAGGVAQMPSCQPCPFGTKASADHLSCVNICDHGAGEILDLATQKCVVCPGPSKTVYTSGSLGHCEACEYGLKVSADHQSCVPACAPGQVLGTLVLGKDQMADPNAYQCQTCPDNTYASYESAGSSRGVCLPCADGTRSPTGSTQCTPLNCGVNSYQDPDDPHACKSCPPTQIYIPAEKKLLTGPGGKTSMQVVPGHCGCGDNQKLVGDTCVCPTGAINPGGSLMQCACPEGATLDMAAFACVCPQGASYDKASGNDRKCVCQKGSRLENGTCVLPSLQQLPLARKDCSAVGAAFINDPKNASRCIRCPTGRVSNETGNACVTSPARPATPGFLPPRRGTPSRPALRCPPGTAPNAAGIACIRQPDLRKTTPPALLQPRVRRAAPGTPPRTDVPAMRR